jgi:hypothetical protein
VAAAAEAAPYSRYMLQGVATHGQQGHDVTSPKTAPNGGCVVVALSDVSSPLRIAHV